MTDEPRMKADWTRMSLLRASVGAMITRVFRAMTGRRDDRVARQAFLGTFLLDDRMLDDIGVTREEVHWAAGLPLHVDAADALCTRAHRRRAGGKA